MNQSFFIGAVGAHQQQKRLNVQGNNIANVNTYGFKAEKGRFAEPQRALFVDYLIIAACPQVLAGFPA